MADTTGNHVYTPTESQPPGTSEHSNPLYIAYVLVPVFFLLGLLGVLICHVLQRKGYRCTTEAEEEEVKDEEKDLEQGADLNDTYSESNNDTVGQIVLSIMKNEANSDALKAMVHGNSIDSDGPATPTSPVTPTFPATPLSPVAPVAAAEKPKHTCNHLHTIGGVGANQNICNRCNLKKGWPLMRRVSNRKADRRSYGEVTVLAVGRFRVTKCDKPARERRTLLISDSNGSMPSSPVEAGPPSRTPSESQAQEANTK
ncbi:RELT-like protein 1 [Hypomesus transpacificus]|uniref:RELT-like protein 1 n=1 Tax=Hypomesus transpacificus TaxID=137520 RepID=UPI001F0886EB|nr:RELT-like protein 1 [Hypomesus transpacificus]